MTKTNKTKLPPEAESVLDEVEKRNADPADTEIKRLAALSRVQYEQERKSVAEKLNVRASILDRLVGAARKEQSELDQGSAVIVEDVKPWSKPVDGAALLDEMREAMASHIAMTDAEVDTVVLWCVYSHAYELFPVAPRLGIRAATAECGKTEALRRIKRFVNRPLECDGLTAAVFFRIIDAHKPTFLLDELDNMLPEDKGAMLGAMNSGYSRKGRQMRCVGDENEVRAFRTFAPFVYAMVGKPTNTFDSRTIPIEMRKATPEKARALLSLEDEDNEDKRLSDMGRKAARWVADHRDKLAKIRPDMGELVNRPAMNWRPLFAVADLAGGDWAARARKAAAAAMRARGDQDIKAELIVDIKGVMDASPAVEEWASAMLAEHLVRLEGRPWAEFGKAQKPITQNTVARLLRPFGIAPTRIGPEDGRARGYRRWQFKEVFDAYAAPPPSRNRPTVQNAMDIEQVGTSQPSSAPDGWTVGKSQKPASSLSSGHLDGWKRGVASNSANGGGSSAPVPPACAVCGRSDPPPNQVAIDGLNVWLHRECEAAYLRTPQPTLAEPAARTNGARHQVATEKQPTAVADVPGQAEPPAQPPVADVIEPLSVTDQSSEASAQQIEAAHASAPDPVPPAPAQARPMPAGDLQRAAIRARNQEALRRFEAELRGRQR
jgi:putative DNA primase/helicase